MAHLVRIRVKPEHLHLYVGLDWLGPARPIETRFGLCYEISVRPEVLEAAGFVLHWTHDGYRAGHVREDEGWRVVGSMENGPVGGLILTQERG